MLSSFLFIIAAYLLGSISTAIVTCRLMGLADPRGLGSGNPGATNVLRVGGKMAAFITLLGDVLKGLIPVGLSKLFGAGDLTVGAVALAAVVGHMFPIYFKFNGGKGVATLLGVLLGMSWLLGVMWAITWLSIAAIFRVSSLAGLVSTSLAPVYSYWILGSVWLVLANAILAILVFWRHRSNIRNLLDGTETKI